MPYQGDAKIYVGSTLISSPGGNANQFPGASTTDGVTGGSSLRDTVTATASATPHTPGSYAEIDASLSGDAGGVFLRLTANTASSGTNSSTVIEIATGASGSEVAWATVAIGYLITEEQLYVPGFIASGTRVAVRVRSNTASKAVSAIYTFLASPTTAPGAPVTMGGTNIATTSRGVSITAPGSLNTKGAWTEIVASTSAAFTSLMVGCQADGDTSTAVAGTLVDIGIGAASSETVLISDIYLVWATNESFKYWSPATFGVSIPAGSRLSARYQRADANNPLDVILVGA